MMMLRAAASNGETMLLHWFEKGARINTKAYLKVLQNVVKPWTEQTFPNGSYAWQVTRARRCRSGARRIWRSSSPGRCGDLQAQIALCSTMPIRAK